MRIALYQPEIAGNVGAVLRLAACFGVAVDVIEPCGFPWNDARMRRAGMDYIGQVEVTRHLGWDALFATLPRPPLLLTTRGDERVYDHAFAADDTLLMGSESAGVPAQIAEACAARLRIPINASVRSLNLGMATGIALGEALRQTGGLPA